MSVVHIHIPAFGIEVERVVHPKLKDVPIVITATTSPRAPLILVSREASKLGIRPGDRLNEALKVEPQLRVIPNNPPLYERAQKKLLQVVQKFTPIYEPSRPGDFYLDMRGMERLFGKPTDASLIIIREIQRETRISPSIGVGENKLVSRVAGKLVKPREICDVFPGSEADFLAPLEVDYLPGLGERTQDTLLRELGIREIGNLASVPTTVLIRVFGKRGQTLKEHALGIDHSVVRLPQEQKAIKEEVILPQETNDEEVLLGHLWDITEKLGRILRERHLVAGACLLEGLYSDRMRASHRITLIPPTNLDFFLFERMENQWRKFITRRISLKLFSVTLTRLLLEFHQFDFDSTYEKETHLMEALDHLRKRFGTKIVRTGSDLCRLPISTATPTTQ
jgi:DNA polymerase IV